MKRDAYFNPNPDKEGWLFGKTRRHQPVKIYATPEVLEAIEKSKGWGITVQAPDENFDRAKPGIAVQVVMVPAIGVSK